MADTRERLTILVAARNAATTIERAIASCLPETECPIVLADDHSTDDTIARAQAVAGRRLRVLRSPDPGGVSQARQSALEAVETPFAAWLDADDEWVPGRARRLAAMLDAGHDVAVESIDLHDGPSGAWLRRLVTPGYLRRPGGAVRLFERNHLPGDTQVAFRTRAFRDAGGYDPLLAGPESFDLLLRAVRTGARLAVGDEAGYRMYAYPGSLSRNLARQRAALAAALRKHPYEAIRQLYLAGGHSARVAAWGLVMVAQFRDEADKALAFLEDASPADASPVEILEPDGPWPFSEGWRRAFHRGTILLMLGGHDADAAEELRGAEAVERTAEGANNLGVAFARLDERARAADWFAEAAARFPGYLDAAVNVGSPQPSRITTHPLRRTPSRHEYGGS